MLPSAWPAPRAVLFDRDGTLVTDVPFNADPARVRVSAGASESLARLRNAGLAVGVVSNQSGIGLGKLRFREVEAVNAQIRAELGSFDVWLQCPHAESDGCACRKPAPGMVVDASRILGIGVDEIVVVGDIGSDVEAAAAAGARGILVPTPATRADEVAAAREAAPTLHAAVDAILGAP